MSHAIWRWLECVKNVKVGSGHVCVVLGAHVRAVTQINGCSLMQTLHKHHWCLFWFIIYLLFWCLCKSGFFYHTDHSILYFDTLQCFRGFFAFMWLEIWDNMHPPNARYLTYCNLHILAWEVMKVSNCWVVFSIAFIFLVNLIGQRTFSRDKTSHFYFFLFSCIPSSNCYNIKIQRVIHAHLPLWNSPFPRFKFLRIIKSHFNPKHVHENFTTNIEWNASSNALSQTLPWERGNYRIHATHLGGYFIKVDLTPKSTSKTPKLVPLEVS